MIRLRTAVRVMPAFWLAIPTSMFAGWYATFLYPSDGYALGATALGTGSLPFVGALTAGCAAWEGSRLRRGHVWNAPSVRSQFAIALWSVTPAVLAGLVAVLVAITVQLARSGAGLPDLRLVAMTVLDLVAFGAAGFACGVLLPIAVAGPIAIVTPFLWLAFVPAMYPVWLRHLTGMFRDCCGLGQDLAPRAVIASSVVDLGIIGAAAILLAGGTLVARRAAGALATLAAAGGVGVLLVGGMTYAPAIPRNPDLLQCRADGGVTVCTWPEHSARAAEVAGIVGRVRAGWQQTAISSPSLFTEADPAVAPADALVFMFNSTYSEDEVIASLAAGMLPTFPECPSGATGGIAVTYLEAWYAASGGMTPGGLRERYAGASEPYPDVLTVVDQLWAAPSDVRRAWVARAEQISQYCDDWPLDLILVHP